MVKPNFQEEKKLWKKGYKRVVGLDEAGRGPLAGPVVAAAIITNWRTFLLWRSVLLNIKDSKQLSAKQREYFYKILISHPAVEWGIGIVPEKVIDKINIKNASELAMEKALEKIQNSKCKSQNNNSKFKIDYLLIDGNNIKNRKLKSIRHKLIIRGDEKVFSCAAASIIAKVTRDRIMKKYHKKYPKYRLDIHKGYPTKFHCKMLKKYGSCKIHRKTFAPVARLNH